MQDYTVEWSEECAAFVATTARFPKLAAIGPTKIAATKVLDGLVELALMSVRVTHLTDSCPACGVSWISGEIPEDKKWWFCRTEKEAAHGLHYHQQYRVYSTDLERKYLACPECGRKFDID